MSGEDFDKELAWDLSQWGGLEHDESDSGLSTQQVRSLAAYLSQLGYRKVEVASASYIESIGATLAKEFIPAYEAIRKAKFGERGNS